MICRAFYVACPLVARGALLLLQAVSTAQCSWILSAAKSAVGLTTAVLLLLMMML
jgi:hypothetical protein